MKENLNILINRLKSDTPEFFKKLRKYSVYAGIIAGIVITASTGGLALPAVLVSVAQYTAVIAGSVVATSSLTKVDKPEYK